MRKCRLKCRPSGFQCEVCQSCEKLGYYELPVFLRKNTLLIRLCTIVFHFQKLFWSISSFIIFPLVNLLVILKSGRLWLTIIYSPTCWKDNSQNIYPGKRLPFCHVCTRVLLNPLPCGIAIVFHLYFYCFRVGMFTC